MNRNTVINTMVHGMRREIRRTNFLYRSDALDERDQSNREDYYRLTNKFLSIVLTLIPILTLSYLTINEVTYCLDNTAREHANTISELENEIAELERESRLIENDINWAIENAKMSYLSYEDYTFFTRRRHEFHPKKHRTINSFNAQEARHFTGFTCTELRTLKLHWRIPFSATRNGQRFDGEEAMIIFLYLLRKGHYFTDMSSAGVFGGDPREFSNIIFWIVNYMYKTFYHKISGHSLNMWLPHWVDEFRYAIWDRFNNGYVEEITTLPYGSTARDLYWLEVPKEQWRYFGFMDCLGIETCHVGDSLRRENQGTVPDLQRTYYR